MPCFFPFGLFSKYQWHFPKMDYPCACARVFWIKQTPFFLFKQLFDERSCPFQKGHLTMEGQNFLHWNCSCLSWECSGVCVSSLCDHHNSWWMLFLVRWSHAGLDLLYHREGAWSPRGRWAGKMSNFPCMQQFIMQLSWIEILCPEMGVIKP